MDPSLQNYLELIKKFPLRTIQSDSELAKAVDLAKSLDRKHAQSRLTVDEQEYLEVLRTLIEQYKERDRSKPYRRSEEPHLVLQRLMREHGLTQTDVIEMTKEHKSNVSAFVNGKRNISRTVAEQLAERFNVDPDLFMQKMEMSSRARIYCDGGPFDGLFTVKLLAEKLKFRAGKYELEPYTYKGNPPPYYPVFVWISASSTQPENYAALKREVEQTYKELTRHAHTHYPNSLEERQNDCAQLIARLDAQATKE